MTLQGKIALVTGGSRGIGLAICRVLAADGARVVVNYRSSELAAKELVDEITASGGQASAVAADVADAGQVETMVRGVLAEHGDLHVLVNNAGISRDGLIYAMSTQDWLEVMATNFGGVFNCTKAILPHFMARGTGAIVNVSSVMGERGWTGQANYAASKGAVNAFTRTCAMESARFGIRVNAVLPGFCPTELVGALAEGDSGAGIRGQIPMRRMGEAMEIARAVRFLAGGESSYLTGALITVDGGATTALGLGKVR